MALRTVTVPITSEGRDKGKVFLITEMVASRAEKWGARALAVSAKAGGDIPVALATAGLAGFASAAIIGFSRAPFHETEPLLDEMFSCVQITPDPSKPMIVRSLVENDIEEVMTRILLRQEVMQLHVGFFKDAVELISKALAMRPAVETLSDTQIKRKRSGR